MEHPKVLLCWRRNGTTVCRSPRCQKCADESIGEADAHGRLIPEQAGSTRTRENSTETVMERWYCEAVTLGPELQNHRRMIAAALLRAYAEGRADQAKVDAMKYTEAYWRPIAEGGKDV